MGMEAKKPIRLFGFKLDTDSQRACEGGQDSTGSEKKYGCQFCLKEFANSQALGGHQNAHKKERLKKKRLELQTKKSTGIGCYLQPIIKNHGMATMTDYVSFFSYNYGHSYRAPEFMLFEPSPYASGYFAPVQPVRSENRPTIAKHDRNVLDLQLGFPSGN